MGMKTVATKIDEDGELYQDFEEFVKHHDTTSEAVRRALREGLNEVQDDEPVGFVDAAVNALADDAYGLIRDSVITTAVLLMFSTVISAYSPWWAGAVLNTAIAAGVGISLLAGVGGVIGVTIRAWDRFGPEVHVETSDSDTATEELR
jgi:hypothetical protein